MIIEKALRWWFSGAGRGSGRAMLGAIGPGRIGSAPGPTARVQDLREASAAAQRQGLVRMQGYQS